MNALHVLPEQMTQRLAWGLVHFVWQGTAVAVLLALTLWLGRIRRPSTRYAISLIALLLMAVCPVITFVWIQPAPVDVAVANERPSPATSVAEATRPMNLLAVEASVPPSMMSDDGLPSFDHMRTSAIATDGVSDSAPQLMADSMEGVPDDGVTPLSYEALPARSNWSLAQPWIVSGWLLGVAAFSIRLLLGWIGVWRLRGRVEPVPEWIFERVHRLAEALCVTQPLIQLSHRVTEAIAVGFLRPMILLPVAWVTELPPDMIEAVIAHELAHIRRGDLWVNLFQRLVETLLFYHPAVWWLSRRLRIERELCCDELVVRTMQNPLRYAETLEHIGRLSLADSLGLAHPPLHVRSMLTVSIGSPRSILLTRIRAILNLPERERTSHAWLAGLIPLTVACLIGWSLISRSTAPANDEPSGATGGGFGPPVLLSRDDEN
ncbi:MAG: M56 family metallopeptidase, partial [Candidatus Saccharimonas sp.]|nr:M56 family metallopeptidase [Planctomycetaceae bacterium]